MDNIEKFLEVAKEAAYEAGEIQLSYIGKTKEIERKSNINDLVTDADKKCEEKVISIIKTYLPDHDILAEETGCHNENNSDYLWIIDPIDGTTNFAHNFPHFAVSIGLVEKGEIVLGVVYDACKNELFWATKGGGAYLNSEQIQVSNTPELQQSLLATGFPPKRSVEFMERSFDTFKKFMFRAQAIRRPGAASLDICYAACGRLDGFWEMKLSPWDVTAGVCIAREAGATVTNFESEDFDIYIKSIIVSNGLIHSSMRDIIENREERNHKSIMHIYSDRVEIWADNEKRGGWQIWSVDDLREAEKMAQEFNCKIVREDQSQQLTLGIATDEN